jgi:hypothetical protein
VFQQALESYDLVKLRTVELERIHSTSLILRQLRQFVHCKAQLDHLLKASSEVGGIQGGAGIYVYIFIDNVSVFIMNIWMDAYVHTYEYIDIEG